MFYWAILFSLRLLWFHNRILKIYARREVFILIFTLDYEI